MCGDSRIRRGALSLSPWLGVRAAPALVAMPCPAVRDASVWLSVAAAHMDAKSEEVERGRRETEAETETEGAEIRERGAEE